MLKNRLDFIEYTFTSGCFREFLSRKLGLVTWISVFVVSFFLSVSAIAQSSEPYKWSNVAIGGGGFVSGIITSKEQPGLIYARTDVGGAYRWDATGGVWIPLMDWASDQQQGMFGVESIAIDPKSPNIVYMSAGISYFNSGKSYILRSTDYGDNFTIVEVTSQFKMHGNGMGRQTGEKLQVDPNNSAIVYCGTRWNGLFKSTNSGTTWSRLTALDVTTTANENGVSFVLPDKSSVSAGVTQRIFAGISRTGNSQNFYKSEDAGTTFTAVVNPNLGAGLMPQRAVMSGDGSMFITYSNGAGPFGTTAEPMDKGEIWKYTIATGAWTNISPPTTRALSGISVDPANPKRLVASTINTYMAQGSAWGDRFFLSDDGGTTWMDIIASRGFVLDPNGVTWVQTSSIHWSGCIEFDPSNTNRVLVTSGNGIFVNEDINTSKVWKFNVKGLEETVPLNAVSIPDGPLISVIGDYDGFRHVDIKQYAPIHTPRIGTTTGLDYAGVNINKVVRVGDKVMYYSNDIGVSWIKTDVTNGSKGQVAISADGNTILHSPESSTVSYKSTNNGTSWTAVSGLDISGARPVSDKVNSSKFYAYNTNSGVMMLSTDGGASFSAGGSPGSGGSKVIRAVPGKEGHLWVALYNGGLTRSVNSGASFTKLTNVATCGAVGIGKMGPAASYETIYIYGTVNGVLGIHRSTDEGVSWVRVNDDEHEYGGPANGQFVIGDMNVFGQVYMSTAGRGIAVGTSLPRNPLVFGTHIFSLDENSAGGTVLGTLMPADPTVTGLHTWSILSGNTGNVFSINAITGTLTVAAGAIADFEKNPVFSLDIGVFDNKNTAAQGIITVNLRDINEAPVDISLSKTAIVQNNAIAAVIGNLNTTDVDANSTFTYTLVTGNGSTDNAAFSISGSELKAVVVFNYMTKPTYSIRVKTTDNGGLSFEKVFTINVNKVAPLPVNNFTVKVFNELCSGNNDGKISIDATENLAYNALLTGEGITKNLPFTKSLEISLLGAGSYSLCITAEGLAGYKQCYDLTITEPQPLSVYSSVNMSDKNIVLNLSGADSYQIRLNGKTFNTTSDSVKLALVSGLNNLVVSTDKYCQGVFTKSFFVEDGKLIYPNPFNDILNVTLGNDTSPKAIINIYALSGSLAFSKEVLPQDSAMRLDLSDLVSGIYIMKIRTALGQSSVKIIKK